VGTDAVTYRFIAGGNAGFIKQYTIDRTPDTGNKYTASGTVTFKDGYADDNNRFGLALFTDPTAATDRKNLNQISIRWGTDDNTVGGAPGSNADDSVIISSGFEGTPADASNPGVLRNQTIPFAQDILQGGQVTWSADFWFTGTNIYIDATMTDPGGVTSVGTAVVAADDYTNDYFGFVSAWRARNYDGDPDPTGADRDNPLVVDYESFSVVQVPEPATVGLFGLGAIGVWIVRRNKQKALEQEEEI
jgi:hypothetical protein